MGPGKHISKTLSYKREVRLQEPWTEEEKIRTKRNSHAALSMADLKIQHNMASHDMT